MTVDQNSKKDGEPEPVAVDLYGIKLSGLRPGDLHEAPPKTWREVRSQLGSHLKRIATGPTRVIAEGLDGIARIFRGTSELPSAVAERIAKAHDKAEAGENANQANHAQPQLDDALDKIQKLLERCRAKGLPAKAVIRSDGSFEFLLGVDEEERKQLPPGVEPKLLAAADEQKT